MKSIIPQIVASALSSYAQLIVPLVAVADGFAVIRVATDLEQPVYVTAPPGDDSRLFIVEANSGGSPSGPKIARVKILNLTGPNAGSINETPFLTVDGIMQIEDQGLFTLEFHPNFSQNRYFYINHTNSDGTASVIERYQVSAADPNLADAASKTTIMTIPKPFINHSGDWIGFSPMDVAAGKHYLYYTTGDGGMGTDPGDRAQNLSVRNGKLFRIDVGADGLADDFPSDPLENYTIPADNPFRNTPGADPAIWSYGFRNPWRASFDRQTGNLYIGDVGHELADEVNLQPFDSTGGENYGWSRLEGTGVGPNPTPVLTTSVAPMFEYRHGGSLTGGPARSVTGGYVYRGPVQELQGQYIFADFLGDYNFATRTGRAQIFSLRYDGSDPADFDGSNIVNDEVVNRTAEFQPIDGTIDFISSFGEDALGNLYIVDMGNLGTPDGLGLGEIYKIVPRNLAFGDFNADAVVDAADYALWRDGLGTRYTQIDYDLWRANFGKAVANGSITGAAVPEPATLGLLILGAAGQCVRKRRRVLASRIAPH